MTSIVGQITCQVPYLQRQVSMASLLVVRKNTYIAIFLLGLIVTLWFRERVKDYVFM